jgi:hypothetical protein
MTRRLWAFSLVTLATAALIAAVADAQTTFEKPRCFRSSDWRGWKATPDASAIYIRVSSSRIYRVDFAHACNALRHGNHLFNRVRGSGRICTAIDLDLRVSVGRGMSTPCIASKLTELTPEEAAALPKSLRP